MESSSTSNDHYEISTYIGESELNISTHRIAKQLNDTQDISLNNHLRRLYKEQQKRKRSQERRKRFTEKWGILFCCCLS